MMIILRKTSSRCIKNLLFKQVICVLLYFGLIAAHKFTQVHVGTPNITYRMFWQLNIHYEYSMTAILHKPSSGRIKNRCLKNLFAFCIFFSHNGA